MGGRRSAAAIKKNEGDSAEVELLGWGVGGGGGGGGSALLHF